MSSESDLDSKKKEKIDVNVTIDDKAQREMNRELLDRLDEKQSSDSEQELREENEDLKNKLGIIAERAIEKKLDQLGVTSPELRAHFVKNPSELMSFEQGQKMGLNQKGPAPSGDIPLSSAQLGQSGNLELLKKRFPSVEAMIKHLRTVERNSTNPYAQNEAKLLLEKLFQKTIKSQKETGQPIQAYDPNTIENLPPLKKVGDFVTPIDPTEGDLGQFKKTRERKESEKKALEGEA